MTCDWLQPNGDARNGLPTGHRTLHMWLIYFEERRQHRDLS